MSKSPKKSKSLTRAGNRPATISAQQTIPYVRMLPDGICQLPGGVYTKTLEYEDINYSVASAEDQTAIFGGWSSWLNYFDSSLPFQLSFVNRRSRSGSRYKVNISEADDRFNSVRTEYTGMLKNQIAKSNNGIERAKYVTFCIPAENVAAARPRLERVEADVIGNFKRLGVQSQPLDGRERLALLHGQLHPGSREPFRFKWADIAHTGMGTKDFKGPAYERWAKVYNLKQMAAALQYLKEHQLFEYDDLAAKTDAATERFHTLAGDIQQTEAELSRVSDLMAAVVQYAKTRPAFDGYKAAKYSRKYLAEHEAELADYRAAKATMAELLGGEKLPKMDVLKEKRRQLAARKKALYLEYRKAQQDMRELVAVKGSVDHLRGLTDNPRNKEQAR